MLDVPAVTPRDNKTAAIGRSRDWHRRSLNENLPHRLEQRVPRTSSAPGRSTASSHSPARSRTEPIPISPTSPPGAHRRGTDAGEPPKSSARHDMPARAGHRPCARTIHARGRSPGIIHLGGGYPPTRLRQHIGGGTADRDCGELAITGSGVLGFAAYPRPPSHASRPKPGATHAPRPAGRSSTRRTWSALKM